MEKILKEIRIKKKDKKYLDKINKKHFIEKEIN